MKAPDFAYCRPASIDAVCALLAEHRDDARILAGGQSLMATLNLRLSAPALLVDINRIDALRGIGLADDGSYLRIGALARHAEVARSSLVALHAPLITAAMRHVAHPAIRNRGTTCGSLALADPSAEMPACAIALDATLVLQSQSGTRGVPAREFFFGLYETARRDDELLIEVRIPCRPADQRVGFDELSRRHGDFAMVGVAATARGAPDRIADLRLVVFGTDTMPVDCRDAAALAIGQAWSAALGDAIASAAAASLDPDTNMFGGPAVKRRQAAALTRRVLTAMLSPDGALHG